MKLVLNPLLDFLGLLSACFSKKAEVPGPCRQAHGVIVALLSEGKVDNPDPAAFS